MLLFVIMPENYKLEMVWRKPITPHQKSKKIASTSAVSMRTMDGIIITKGQDMDNQSRFE